MSELFGRSYGAVPATRACCRQLRTTRPAAGDAALDPSVQQTVLTALSDKTAASPTAADGLPDGLTPREAQVLTLIADGLTNARIAEYLVVSPATVSSHFNHLFAKAGIRDRAQAVRYAYSHGLARPPE